MGGVCRTSGVISSSTVVSKVRSLLTSLHIVATHDGANDVTIKIWDSNNTTTTSKTEITRFVYSASDPALTKSIEYDMHNVVCDNGIYVQITAGGSSSAALSVEFS